MSPVVLTEWPISKRGFGDISACWLHQARLQIGASQVVLTDFMTWPHTIGGSPAGLPPSCPHHPGEIVTTTFDQLLDSYRDLSDFERMKGSHLEQLVEQYLENDGVYAPQYTDVWLWKDWPNRPENFTNKDNGIDLVAARTDGGLRAIQMKFLRSRLQDSEAGH